MFTIVTSFLLPLHSKRHWFTQRSSIPPAGSHFRRHIQTSICLFAVCVDLGNLTFVKSKLSLFSLLLGVL